MQEDRVGYQTAGSSESNVTLSTGPKVSKWHLISPGYLCVCARGANVSAFVYA
jgi:hypothetical protein